MYNQKLLYGSFTLISLGYQLKGREKKYILGNITTFQKFLEKKCPEKKNCSKLQETKIKCCMVNLWNRLKVKQIEE